MQTVDQEIKQIKKQIRELKKEMKEMGIRRISCFNGGLTSEEYRFNAKMFELSVELTKAKEIGQ